MKERDVKEKISEGWIHVRVILEMLGKPKEHIETTLREYVKQIKEQEKKVAMINEYYSEAKEQGEKKELFAVFAELEMLVKNPETLVWLSFDYMPSSIEIIEPETLRYKRTELANFVNDLLARLHDVDMKFKNVIIDSNLSGRSNEILLKKLVLALLKNKSATLEELSDSAGIDAKALFIFLGSMINDNFIKKEGEKYLLVEE